MIIEEIIFFNGACSPKGNGLFCLNSHESRLRAVTPHSCVQARVTLACPAFAVAAPAYAKPALRRA